MQFLSFGFLFLCLFVSLHSYSFIFEEKLPFSKCNTPQIPNFAWSEKHFTNEKQTFVELELHAKKLAELRYSQLLCLRKFANSEQNLNQILLLLESFRNSELELLEYGKNYFMNFEKKYLLQKHELEAMQFYLNSKQELYSVLHIETIRAFQEEPKIWVFEKLYLAQLKNHFEFFQSLRKEVRQKILSEIY